MNTYSVLLVSCILTIVGTSELSMRQLVETNGYPFEEHIITTEDGFILKTQRIPHGRNSNKNNDNPVLLSHGMGGCAENFLMLGPEKALAYQLAENGFDVWLMNARGNFFSRKHQHLDPDSDIKFWKHSWHEIGMYDLPANIDYILNVTNHEKLFYIGHSQGGTIYYVLTSEKPEYNDKIRMSAQLGPAVFLHLNNNNIGTILCEYTDIIESVSKEFHMIEMVPPTLQLQLKTLCSPSEVKLMCFEGYQMLGGGLGDLTKIKADTISFLFRSSPSGISMYQFLHYLQNVKSKCFRQYDHGISKNLQIYNSSYPPKYNLGLSTAPVLNIYSVKDWFSSERNYQMLSNIKLQGRRSTIWILLWLMMLRN
ncbi:lipase 3-like isoform X2 [Aethina tumida]|uniref:lipase 3-like isoform X2 n=1 Tax=Aethina tumida TaxID=116153 RepID=UPI0021478F02|nr:lipase 3-like isoform X2 [Aethina tumida]